MRTGGPIGGLGYDIRYNFDNHEIWYVTDASAGFHISADHGLTWKASNQGISSFEGTINLPVFSATVDPHNPSTTWQAVITGDSAIGAVEYCVQNPQIAYAGGEHAVYRSEDGGRTWQKFSDEQRGAWG